MKAEEYKYAVTMALVGVLGNPNYNFLEPKKAIKIARQHVDELNVQLPDVEITMKEPVAETAQVEPVVEAPTEETPVVEVPVETVPEAASVAEGK